MSPSRTVGCTMLLLGRVHTPEGKPGLMRPGGPVDDEPRARSGRLIGESGVAPDALSAAIGPRCVQ